MAHLPSSPSSKVITFSTLHPIFCIPIEITFPALFGMLGSRQHLAPGFVLKSVLDINAWGAIPRRPSMAQHLREKLADFTNCQPENPEQFFPISGVTQFSQSKKTTRIGPLTAYEVFGAPQAWLVFLQLSKSHSIFLIKRRPCALVFGAGTPRVHGKPPGVVTVC